jgi:starch phosphorylase
MGRNLIIRDGQVHMANLCLASCYMVNGVSRLHGDILKDDLFHDIYTIRPERFTYVTNGIDHRRWLAQINPNLHEVIIDLLGGDEYLLHPELLYKLSKFEDDESVRRDMLDIKYASKLHLADFAMRNDGFALNTDAVMDVQIKRLHEYKRQLLCAMNIVALQLRLHDNPNMEFMPRTYVFGAKAAAGYKTAKRIIELILSLANDINNDPVCKDKLQVYFVENYRVSAAEAIVPAAQVSEQISTAGKEASGTGCMKLMMNGAVTIGTLDGANVEMYDRLGDDNMFLFGLHTEDIATWRAGGYDPNGIVGADPELQRVTQRIMHGFSDGKSYSDLISNLLYGGDPYMVIADFRSYVDTQEKLYKRISDPSEMGRLSLMNIAKSGFFAADRAIEEYAKNIWHIS